MNTINPLKGVSFVTSSGRNAIIVDTGEKVKQGAEALVIVGCEAADGCTGEVFSYGGKKYEKSLTLSVPFFSEDVAPYSQPFDFSEREENAVASRPLRVFFTSLIREIFNLKESGVSIDGIVSDWNWNWYLLTESFSPKDITYVRRQRLAVDKMLKNCEKDPELFSQLAVFYESPAWLNIDKLFNDGSKKRDITNFAAPGDETRGISQAMSTLKRTSPGTLGISADEYDLILDSLSFGMRKGANKIVSCLTWRLWLIEAEKLLQQASNANEIGKKAFFIKTIVSPSSPRLVEFLQEVSPQVRADVTKIMSVFISDPEQENGRGWKRAVEHLCKILTQCEKSAGCYYPHIVGSLVDMTTIFYGYKDSQLLWLLDYMPNSRLFNEKVSKINDPWGFFLLFSAYRISLLWDIWTSEDMFDALAPLERSHALEVIETLAGRTAMEKNKAVTSSTIVRLSTNGWLDDSGCIELTRLLEAVAQLAGCSIAVAKPLPMAGETICDVSPALADIVVTGRWELFSVCLYAGSMYAKAENAREDGFFSRTIFAELLRSIDRAKDSNPFVPLWAIANLCVSSHDLGE